MGLGCSLLGIALGQGSLHLPQPVEESRGKAYIKDDGKLDSGMCEDLG